MSAISSIILADGQTTPVNHTFVPYSPQVSQTPAVWLEKSASSPTGYWRLTQVVYRNGNGVYKVKMSLAIPVLAIVPAGCCVDSNTPAVSYKELCNIEFSHPSGSTTAIRKDCLAIAKNYLLSAVAVSAIVDLEMAW